MALKETEIKWTIGSHTIDLNFCTIPSENRTYIIKCKPVDDSFGISQALKVLETKVTIDNLKDDTLYCILVIAEDDDGNEELCFQTQKSTKVYTTPSCLDTAYQDENNPWLYHLKPEMNHCQGDKLIEFRHFNYNRSRLSKKTKTVLLVGGVATGKTTLVDVIANFFLEVQYADHYRISITDKKDTRMTGKADIILYKINPPQTSRYEWTLDIVNVEGFSPDEANDEIVQSLKSFLEKRQLCVDLFCLVMRSTSRSTTDQRKILQATKLAFEEFSSVKFAPIFTFHSGGTPLALDVLKDEDIPYYKDLCFLFNNGTFHDCRQEQLDTWNDRQESLGQLLGHLDNQTDESNTEMLSKSIESIHKGAPHFKTKSTSTCIIIEWTDLQKNYKIKYRKENETEWKVIYTGVPKACLDDLSGNTVYEMIISVEHWDGYETTIGETKETTQPSLAAHNLVFATKDNKNLLVHHLNTTTQAVPGGEEKVVNIGCLHLKEEKTVLLFGGQGSGKKTIVDAMINYIFSVEFGDEFRFCLTKESEKIRPRKHKITIFRIPPPNNSKLQCILNIAIVPGFEYRQPEVDKKIFSNLRELLDSGIVQNISFACIVVPSTCRLTEYHRHIFTMIRSALGQDVSFFVPLITFHDGGTNTALDILKEANIKFFDHLYFSFNNSLLLTSRETAVTFKKRNDVLHSFFQEMMITSNISMDTTKLVLASLKELDVISSKEEDIRNRLIALNAENQVRLATNQMEDAQATQEVRKEHSNNKSINCEHCKTTCKPNCQIIWDMFWGFFIMIEAISLRLCGVGNILNCKCKCSLQEHVVENFEYVMFEKSALIAENTPSEEDEEQEKLRKEYRILYKNLKSGVKILKTHALHPTGDSLKADMKTFLERMNEMGQNCRNTYNI